PTSVIYSLSLHDALPIFFIWTAVIATTAMMTVHTPGIVLLLGQPVGEWIAQKRTVLAWTLYVEFWPVFYSAVIAMNRLRRNTERSEEHTSELQSRRDLVC